MLSHWSTVFIFKKRIIFQWTLAVYIYLSVYLIRSIHRSRSCQQVDVQMNSIYLLIFYISFYLSIYLCTWLSVFSGEGAVNWFSKCSLSIYIHLFTSLCVYLSICIPDSQYTPEKELSTGSPNDIRFLCRKCNLLES